MQGYPNLRRWPVYATLNECYSNEFEAYSLSRKNIMQHMPVHVSQSAGEAVVGESELFVIEAEQVQERGVEVVY